MVSETLHVWKSVWIHDYFYIHGLFQKRSLRAFVSVFEYFHISVPLKIQSYYNILLFRQSYYSSLHWMAQSFRNVDLNQIRCFRNHNFHTDNHVDNSTEKICHIFSSKIAFRHNLYHINLAGAVLMNCSELANTFEETLIGIAAKNTICKQWAFWLGTCLPGSIILIALG